MVHEQGERDIEKDLKLSISDYAHSGVKAGLSTAPFVGGPLTEFFALVIAPPLEKRRDAWLIEIYRRLKLLEGTVEGFKIESLATNEIFISILFQATSVAMRAHQKEKLEALTNAVTNIASAPTIDENSQLIFLNLIDRYTPWHLTLLKFFEMSSKKEQVHDRDKDQFWSILDPTNVIIEQIFEDLRGKQEMYDQIVKDLLSNGLLYLTTSFGVKVTNQRIVSFEMTKMGEEFLEFISLRNEFCENK